MRCTGIASTRVLATWPVLAPKEVGPGRLKLAGTPEKPTVAPEGAAAGVGAAAFLGTGAAAAATDGLCGLGCSPIAKYLGTEAAAAASDGLGCSPIVKYSQNKKRHD